MRTHVHVLLATLARGVELILMSVLQLLVSMETVLYAILHMMLSSYSLSLLCLGSNQWLQVLL